MTPRVDRPIVVPSVEEIERDPMCLGPLDRATLWKLHFRLIACDQLVTAALVHARNGHMTQDDRLLTLAEAADLLRCRPSTLRQKLRTPPYDRIRVNTGTRTLRFSERRVQEILRRG